MVPAPSKAIIPGTPITTPRMAKYGENLTMTSFHSFGMAGAFLTKYSSNTTSNFPNIDLKSVPFVSDFAIDVFRIYNNKPKIIANRGVKNKNKDIFPVTGKVGIAAIDISSVTPMVGIGVLVNDIVGERLVVGVGVGVDVWAVTENEIKAKVITKINKRKMFLYFFILS